MKRDGSYGVGMLRSMIDAFPGLVFLVDDDVRIEDCNSRAQEFLDLDRSDILRQRGGDVLNCIRTDQGAIGCGRADLCSQCVIRNAVNDSFRGSAVVRKSTVLEIVRDENLIEIYALITVSPVRHEERSLALLVIEDISEVVKFNRFIPICSVCRKVRDENESWQFVETYFKEHFGLNFSHSLCPECYRIELDKLVCGIETDNTVHQVR